MDMSIASTLFSDSQARIYRWLFGKPDQEFHLSELRRLTGLGSASLQRELNRLADAGLILSARVGNLRRFRANPQSPVYGELVALTRKTLGAESLLRDALRPLTPNLQSAWIYGSYAKQTETALSDIDIMLVGRKLTLGKVLEVLTPLEVEIARKINPTLYTPAEFAKRRADRDSFVNRVLAQAVILLVENSDEPSRTG
jgi:predicted nucleotidyltransferase